MEISSKEDHNVGTAFLTMIKDIHFKNLYDGNISEKINENKSFGSNTMIGFNKKKSNSGCCG